MCACKTKPVKKGITFNLQQLAVKIRYECPNCGTAKLIRKPVKLFPSTLKSV